MKPYLFLILSFIQTLTWKYNAFICIPQVITGNGRQTFRLLDLSSKFSSILKYLDQICPIHKEISQSAPIFARHLERTYFRLGGSLSACTKNLAHLCLKQVNVAISVNKSIPWLGIDTNQNVIRNLSLTLKDIADSVLETLASQQRSIDSLTKNALENRIDFDYLLAEQNVSGLLPTPPAVHELTLLEKLKCSYIRSLSNLLGLKG